MELKVKLHEKRDRFNAKVDRPRCKFVQAARLEQKKHFSSNFMAQTEDDHRKFVQKALDLQQAAKNAVRRARAARAAEAAAAASKPPWRR